MLALSAEAGGFQKNHSKGCGLFNAYVESELKWWDWATVTTTYVRARIYKKNENDGTYDIVSQNDNTGEGVSGHISKEALGLDKSGWYKGTAYKAASFFIEKHNATVGPFYCYYL